MISEAEKVQEIALEFERKDYTVLIDPSSDRIPFDLKNYQPDLIAFKGSGGVIVEIKSSLKRLPIQKFHDISLRISSHQGWKFALVTLDDPVSKLMSIAGIDLPDPAKLKERLNEINVLVGMEMLPNALLSLWVQIESWLRIKSRLSDMPIELLQPQRIINHLYSEGEFSIEQVNHLKDLMQIRNKVVHGFDVTITEKQVNNGVKLLHEIIISTE